MTTKRLDIERVAAWLEQTSHSPHSAEPTVARVMAELPVPPERDRVRATVSLAPERPRRARRTTFAALASAAAMLGVLSLTFVIVGPGSDGAERQPAIVPSSSPSLEPDHSPASREGDGLGVLPGSMTDAGSLTVPRKEHTATLLDDGRVLVVGGQGGGRQLRPLVDRGDPDSERFERLPNLHVARKGHTATRLLDGRVLIAGGHGEQSPSDQVATVEIWDPPSEQSSLAADLVEPRADHTATLLPDGRVLIVGGRNPQSRFGERTSAEIWDPATEASTATGSLEHGRSSHTATLLPDGRVLVVGGMASSIQPGGEVWPVPSGSVEVWEPGSGSFRQLPDLVMARYLHTATRLGDGRVLVAGGADADPDQGLRSVEVWDPATGRTSATGELEFGRVGHTATMLDGTGVLVVGGTTVERAELWDPATGRTSRAGTTAPPRQYHSATLLPNGRVLVVAGRQISESRRNLGPLESAQLWIPERPGAIDEGPVLDPATALAGDSTLARRFPAAVDGQALVVSTRTFADWHAELDAERPPDAAFQDELEIYAEMAGVGLADISLATATHWHGRNPHAVGAVRVPSADAHVLVDPTIELILGHIVEPEVEWIDIVGREVARVRDASMPGAYPGYAYPEGDTIWLVQSEEPILSELLDALP